MTKGKSPTRGLEERNCELCGTLFQPYRANQYTCSRDCYRRLPSTRQRQNTARRSQEFKDRKNAWRRNTPAQVERVRAYNRQTQLAKYGLTPDDYERILAEQGGVCALCGEPPKPNGVRAASKLHADHDHVTGRARALLCMHCNRGLGAFKDDPALLRAAAEFIERHRAVSPA